MMMMIATNSRTRKWKEKRGEVKGEYEELEGRKRGMLTTGEWCNSVSDKLHHVKRG